MDRRAAKARLNRLDTIDDVRRAARRFLPRGLFEYIDRGTEPELALPYYREAYDRLKLRPRVLVDVAKSSTACSILGRSQAMPIAIAPTGAAGLAWFKGDLALARAAAAMRVPFALATRSMSSIESIAEAGGTLWFQLYPSPDERLSLDLLERARKADCHALIITVDTPILPRRDYNRRNGFAIPFSPSLRASLDLARHPGWLLRVLYPYLRNGGLPRLENMQGRPRITEGPPASEMLQGGLTWDQVKALRKAWGRTFMVKGILAPADAIAAVDLGADAIVVSSHGGRNLDGAVAPIEVLPEIVDAVGARAEVFVDSGLRRGSDVAKALALGAKAVLIGRPTLYGAAVGGQAGVEHVLGILHRELLYTMAMTGCPSIASLEPGLIHPSSIRRP